MMRHPILYTVLLLLLIQGAACGTLGSGRGTGPSVVLEDGSGSALPDRPATDPVDPPSVDTASAQDPKGPGPMGDPLDAVLLDPPVLAWLLPFSLDQRGLDALRNPSDQKRNRPMVGLGFWEGALLAADSLEAQGISVDLMAFDTKNSPQEVRKLCERPELQQADVLLGPMFKAPMQEAYRFAQAQGIPVVSPYLRNPAENMLDGQFGVRPDNAQLLEALGLYLAKERRRDNIIVLRRDSAEEVRLTKHLMAGMPDSASRSRVLEWRTDFRLQGLTDTLSLVEHNAIIVPSRDEVFVNAVCRSLATLAASGEHQISVYGLSDWRRFESIALDYLNRIDWHFPVHYWPQTDSAFAEGFERQFRRRFKGPPSPFSYLGYDLTLYFGHHLHAKAAAHAAMDRSQSGQKPRGKDRFMAWQELQDRYPGMLDAFDFERIAKGLSPGEYMSTDQGEQASSLEAEQASDGAEAADAELKSAWLNRHWHLIRYRNWSFQPLHLEH